MTEDKSIFIKNIYYMLTYAFKNLKQNNYEEIEAEKFETIQDLFAVILEKGISQQVKQGLYREYLTKNENLSVMRGKLDFRGTVRNQVQKKRILACEYNALSENNIFNQILKSTVVILLRSSEVKQKYKTALKRVELYLDAVDFIAPVQIQWDRLKYQKNNRNYEMLVNICYFVLDGMIQTTENGNYKMMGFSEKHMYQLFERFVLEYYKKHHSYLSEIRAGQVKWNLSEDTEENIKYFLPVMKTDIFLKYGDQILIIDTKYYGKLMQENYDKMSLHSANLYQIFTYVKNQDVANTGKVSGMLLYAKTQEAISPDCSFVMSGNRISVKTLDLNKEFKLIAEQLDKIIEEHFEIED